MFYQLVNMLLLNALKRNILSKPIIFLCIIPSPLTMIHPLLTMTHPSLTMIHPPSTMIHPPLTMIHYLILPLLDGVISQESYV